ncbi:phosphodiesterase [Thioclava sp. SK-1]|uniref:metallophosphoesterase family protein n=1 Tax=Thioclava sp. SK-1 TaxID=1889770 RepID=UPI0008252DE3|nr:metallophosphoesterase [Thioclava sp. SK-1]OCX66757.1 phosphodiesterase [Thioclava sp. SK-1]
MTRIVHLSDLHFGRSDPELEQPLLQQIHRLAPDLVIISGDFTQRARRSQFAQAREFIDQIKLPVLAVPGNHDTPLDNLYMRFIAPWRRYRNAIDHQLEPQWRDDQVHVVGVNTVNRFAWQRGKISQRMLRHVCHAFENGPDARLNVVVMHHPLEHGPDTDKKLMDGAQAALKQLSDCGADLVLSGHLHEASSGPFRAAPGLMFVQAGTGLSTRLRGAPNTFNMIEERGGELTITRYEAPAGQGFRAVVSETFGKFAREWRPVPVAAATRSAR